ncbi:aminotransferase class III-fold pyridoxal phosphate-dependent enzyme [Candidatus Pelagibacter sp.]|nr:aminotransferase class III-fold pyridoxal phosphate-dependent enzyme [Candidatus Pelagibacter sp.]
MKLIPTSKIDKIKNSDIKKLYSDHVNKGLTQILSKFSYNKKLVKNAEGIYIKLSDNKKILDVTGGIGVLNLGHNNTKILKARINYQKKKKAEVYKLFFSPYLAVLSYNISQLTEGNLKKVFLCNSGAEANEAAMKLAYRYFDAKKKFILTSQNGFHGKLIASGSISGNYSFKNKFPYFKFKNEFKVNDLNSLKRLEKKMKKNSFFGLIIECYSASTLTRVNEKFMKEVFRLKKKYNFLVIFDEIYVGWGKTGYLFSYQKYNKFEPDIITFSKSFGGGKSSISGYVANKKIFSKVYENVEDSLLHTTTYNGFGEECITANEAINIIVNEKYHLKARSIEKDVKENFDILKKKHPDKIVALKGEGALFGIYLNEPFELISKLIQKIPFKFVKNKSEFISKLYAAAVSDVMFAKYNILCLFSQGSLIQDSKKSPAFISFQPSLIIKKEETKYFFNSLNKVLSLKPTYLLLNFLKKILIN